MCACVAVPAAEVARSPAATHDIEVGAVSPVPPATSAPLTAMNPLNLPRLSIGSNSYNPHRVGKEIPESDEKKYGVNRAPHPVTGSTCMFFLHDRPHGDPLGASGHRNCMHRLPDLIMQLELQNTVVQEQFNRSASVRPIVCVRVRLCVRAAFVCACCVRVCVR